MNPRVAQAVALELPVPAAAPPRLRSLSPHLLLVANGNASGVHRHPELVQSASRLLRSAGARVESWVTETLDELDEALAGAERRVVLLGGDGSLHAAANSGAPTPELALLPAGGANNVARSLGVPLELGAAARLAVEGQAWPLDLIAARTETSRTYAVEGVSAGFHALARARYNGANSADVGGALRAGLASLRGFAPLTIALELDGACRLVRIAQLFVANMPLFGPRLHVAPDADPTDGLLDVVTIERDGVGGLLALVPSLRRGTHLERAGVRHTRAHSVRIATRGQSPVIADTTNLGTSPVDLSVERDALRVVGAAA
jgi:diacylglycerol kinase (ATP)